MRIVDGSIERRTTPDGQKISFVTRDVREADELFDRLRGKQLTVKIEPIKYKRSLDANAYMWMLCEKIADAIHVTREEVYRKAVRETGVYDDLAIVAKALPMFAKNWSMNGIGWFVEVFDSKLEGCKKVRVYYGSSTYDTKQMSRLIDYIVDEAKDLGIETMTPDQITEMIGRWES